MLLIEIRHSACHLWRIFPGPFHVPRVAGCLRARMAGPDGQPELALPKEHGGPKGKEPTRYGDWEIKGKAVDF